ncbi:MAG: 30S ribosomal protein S13 [Candidatus Omnitrophica bacterium]|nr:30S ribosomal protein S13 [Candidatus Omnitrophota bacterium]
MPRIVGIDLPRDKKIDIALTYLFGIGRSRANNLLRETQIDANKRANDLNDEEIAKLAQLIQSRHRVEGDLRREIAGHIKRLIDIGSYRGSRHKRGLPVRGQRTRTNARTRKGPRPRVGVRKKPTTARPAASTAAAKA